MILCLADEAAKLLEQQHVPASQLILLNFGDARSEALRPSLASSGLLFVLGASPPTLMRAMLGSILEFRIGRGSRGLLPRLIKNSEVSTNMFSLLASDQRPEAQAFASQCLRCAYQEGDRILKTPGFEATSAMAAPAADRSWHWPGSSFVSKAVADILDELMMNAIWDAHPALRHAPRSEVCQLDPDKPVLIECASDGVTFAITVEDREGTFPWRALAGPLAFALGLKPDLKVNEGPGGAGLGLFMILQRTSILTLEVQKGQHTRVSAILRIDDSARDMQARPKTVLVYSDTMEGCITPT
jgi:anti-sigma regulatory factor (Ser/Thr protein kinase)